MHTQIFRVIRVKTEKGDEKEPSDLPVENVSTKNDQGEFHMDNFPSQDAMAWETQGAVTDRAQELLGESDRGITMFRKLLREQILVVQQGGDPIGLVWDPKKNRLIEFITSECQGPED